MRGRSGQGQGRVNLVDDMGWIELRLESFLVLGFFEEFPKKGRRGLKMCQSILFEG